MTQITTSLLTIDDIANYRTSTIEEKNRITEIIKSSVSDKPKDLATHLIQLLPECIRERATINGLGEIIFFDYQFAIVWHSKVPASFKVMDLMLSRKDKERTQEVLIWVVSVLSKKLALSNIYMDVAKRYASLSTCTRRKVGAILVKKGRVISTGTNGSPDGLPHCIDDGCLLDDKGHCQRTVHAEQNSILFCATHGISMNGASIVCTDFPCTKCLQSILQTGISSVYFDRDYTDAHNKILAKATSHKIGFYHYDKGIIKTMEFEKDNLTK